MTSTAKPFPTTHVGAPVLWHRSPAELPQRLAPDDDTSVLCLVFFDDGKAFTGSVKFRYDPQGEAQDEPHCWVEDCSYEEAARERATVVPAWWATISEIERSLPPQLAATAIDVMHP